MLKQRCPLCNHQALNYEGDYVSCYNCGKYSKKLNFWQRYLSWAIGKNPWIRLIPTFYFLLIFADLLKGNSRTDNLLEPLGYLNFGIHELGHILFAPFGEFLHIAGGSLFQLMFPLLWMLGFAQKKMYFAATLCFCWLGQNFYDVAHYAADAQDRLLPLAVGPAGIGLQGNDDAYDRAHDWYQLLVRTDQLENTDTIAFSIQMLGNIAFITGFVLCFILLYYMIKLKKIEKF